MAEPLSPEATFVIPLGIAGTPEPWHVRIVLADGHVVKVWEVADRAAYANLGFAGSEAEVAALGR